MPTRRSCQRRHHRCQRCCRCSCPPGGHAPPLLVETAWFLRRYLPPACTRLTCLGSVGPNREHFSKPLVSVRRNTRTVKKTFGSVTKVKRGSQVQPRSCMVGLKYHEITSHCLQWQEFLIDLFEDIYSTRKHCLRDGWTSLRLKLRKMAFHRFEPSRSALLLVHRAGLLSGENMYTSSIRPHYPTLTTFSNDYIYLIHLRVGRFRVSRGRRRACAYGMSLCALSTRFSW